eukprot:TRINITY_DN7666_c0_g3_i2.p1 TRINITY_DN7666_c0_g3~~TRINITY_DN7666_c0_g3_i2.p1  ORF type:complete len:712 (+),score=155.21 TRINITY_DN7666_c0_g3_i2:203-2338(+)
MTVIKVTITPIGGTPKDYDLNRDLNMKIHLDVVCKQHSIQGNPQEYTLQVQSTGHYLTEEDLTSNNESILQPGALLILKVRPELAAEMSLKSLKEGSVAVKKKILFDLKDLLKDEIFTRRFLEMEGVTSLISILDELAGNTLAYGLSALQAAMDYGFGWDSVPISFIQKAIQYMESSSPSVCKSALRILILLTDSPKLGFSAVSSYLMGSNAETLQNTSEKQPLSVLITLLGSTDLDIQVTALTLINSLISHAVAGNERTSFLSVLDQLQVNQTLKKQLQTTDSVFKKQLYLFQKQRLSEIKSRRGVPYDKGNTDHEAQLMRLWTATFPDAKLESRVSEQWKLIGFQGTDPATDFRGMGILGLENLLYFAEAHSEVFRRIISTNLARKEREYPVAVAGINLSQMLYDLLRVGETENADCVIFPILFSHRFAFEEMYSTSFQVLDYTWDDMQASYMDFPKVIAAVKKQIFDVVAACPLTLEQFFSAACSKGRGTIGESDDSDQAEPDSIKKLRIQVKKETMELVRSQKIAYLQDGQAFKSLKPIQSKDKKLAPQFMFYKLNDQELFFGPTMEYTERPALSSLSNSLKISDCVSVVVGNDVPSFNKKKVSEDIANLTFALIAKDEKQTQEFLAATRDDFVNWTDGLRSLLGKQMETPETVEELKTLVSLEMKVRLLDLEGVDNIPKDTIPIPPPPPDYLFVEPEIAPVKVLDR